MTAVWHREYEMWVSGEKFIDGTLGKQLRIQFDIYQSPAESFSTADFRIYNLSRETKITRGASVEFKAGYNGSIDTIFTGTVTNVLREREGADIATRLLCRSVATNENPSAAASYGQNSLVVDVLTDLARQWPAQLVIDRKQFDDSPKLISGYVVNGGIQYELDTLGRMYNFEWAHSNGQLIITRTDKKRSTPMIEVSRYTGMEMMPEITNGPTRIGINVIKRLDPAIHLNSRIYVKSDYATFNTGNMYLQETEGDESVEGEYDVKTITYRGDNYGADWSMEIFALRNFEETAQTVPAGALVWGAKVTQEFRNKTRDIASKLNLDPNWLMAVMAFETGESFSPSIRNIGGSSATGLIQFIESTARALGTTTLALSRMTSVQQLDWVAKYYKPYASRIQNLGDCYMAVLWPKAIGVTSGTVLWRAGTQEYTANAGLDREHKGYITRADAVYRVDEAFKRGSRYAK